MAGEDGEAVDRPAVDHQAELRRRYAEAAPSSASDAQVARRRQLRAGTEGGALDGGDGGGGQIDEPGEHGPERATKPAPSTPVRSAPAQNVPPAPVSTSARTLRLAGVVDGGPMATSDSWSTALRRSGRSIVTTPTAPTPVGVDHGSSTATTSPSWTLSSGATRTSVTVPAIGAIDRDLHLHRLEDDELVARVDRLSHLHADLPHVRRDFGSHFGHGPGPYL